MRVNSQSFIQLSHQLKTNRLRVTIIDYFEFISRKFEFLIFSLFKFAHSMRVQ